VVWTIDSSLTTIGVKATGVAFVSGLSLPLRSIIQGTSPLSTATPTLPVKISGQLVTDTDFTSTITFLKTGTIIGENTGDFKPLHDGSDASEPGEIGSTTQLKVGITWTNAVDSTLRILEYDFSAPSAIAITGGNFSGATAIISTTSGDLDYRGYGPGAGLGSGTTEVNRKQLGDATFNRIVDGGDYTVWADNYLGTGKQYYQGEFTGDGLVDGGDYTVWADHYLQTEDPFQNAPNTGADGTIAKVGPNYELTLPIKASIYYPIDDGGTNSTVTTTDDIWVFLQYDGTIKATAPAPGASSAIPEPSSLALSVIAGLGMAVVGIHRKLRRRA
jgi:hypothetical protein